LFYFCIDYLPYNVNTVKYDIFDDYLLIQNIDCVILRFWFMVFNATFNNISVI